MLFVVLFVVIINNKYNEKLIIPTNTQLTYFIQLLSEIITQCKFVKYLQYWLYSGCWVVYVLCVLVKKQIMMLTIINKILITNYKI